MDETDAPAAQHCPRCQGRLRAGAKFCPACGAALDPAALQPERATEPAVQASPGSRFDLHWSEFRLIAKLFGLLLLASLVIGLVGRNDSTPWSDVSGSIAEVMIVLWFACYRYHDISPLLGAPQADRRTALRLFGLCLGFVALLQLYFYLIEKAGVPIIHMTAPYQAAGWGIGVMLLVNSAMPAVAEELAFRGIIQSTLERIVGEREALLIQAALFSVLHLLPMMFPSHFIMGLCFGYLRLRTRSLYPGIALHAAWNALVVLQEIF
ncbi:MAG TPA: CPBP family intramembrane glutamic endopeptidase [Gallionellaceae bacterium]